MKTSESTAKIDPIIALVQAECAQVEKEGKVEIEGRKPTRFAKLEALDKAARPALQKYGVAIVQGCEFQGAGGWALATRLAVAGEWLITYYPIKTSRDGAQGFGGGNTFARRWALCGALNLIPNDVEEEQGYTDARAATKVPRKAAAPAGIGAIIEAVRGATTGEAFEAAVRAGRAAHPTGEASAAIERAAEVWIVAELDQDDLDVDGFGALRAIVDRVKPRGSDVRAAIIRAGKRMAPQ